MKKRFVIVRTYSAGCFAGTIVGHKGQEVTLESARRLWYWKGAASLSQLANEGTSCPSECKFPAPVRSIILTQAIEIIDCTNAAASSVMGVPEWKA